MAANAANAPIIQNLHSLLPSYTSPSFPTELVSLAGSLQNLSRSRASNLRPEEEIARGFVCCHLAVDRLKIKLNLPGITVKPPCGPRVYKKLFHFLDKNLPTDIPVAVTPRKPARTVDALAPVTPRRAAPTHAPHVLGSLKKRPDAPEWLYAAASHLAKRFDVEPAAPHVYAGVCEVAKGRRYADEELASLAIAVLILVVQKMGKLGTEARDARMKGVKEMVALRRIGISRMGVVSSDVGRWMDEEGPKWRGMGWWEDVPGEENGEDEAVAVDPRLLDETVGDVEMVDQDEERQQLVAVQDGEGEDEEEEMEARRRLPASERAEAAKGGLGTMFQDAVDFLSDERREALDKWRQGMARKIAAAEKRRAIVSS